MKKALFVLAVCCAMVLPAVSLAGGVATVTGGPGENAHIYWRNGTIVFVQPGRRKLNRIMVTRHNIYFVYAPGTRPRVVEMSGAMGMMRALTGSANRSPRDVIGRIKSVKATGDTETVAGIQGRVFKITTVRNGKSRTYRAVLTDNPVVVSLTNLVIHRALGIWSGQARVLRSYLSAFPKDYQGVLKLGQRYHFTSVSSRAPADKWFQLPAKPQSFMQTMIRNMANKILGGMKQ